MFQKINNFFLEVRQEMAKVSWPSRNELKGTTVIVIVLTIVLSAFIWSSDKVLELLVKLLFDKRSLKEILEELFRNLFG